MSLLNGTLRLADLLDQKGPRLLINFFFRSLAEDRGEQSIGIILSGMGSDGRKGMISIDKANGIAMLQDPNSAKFSGMPSSSAEALPNAIVATAEELPAKLIERLKLGHAAEQSAIEQTAHDENSLDEVIILLREHTGHDFTNYKKNTLVRRIDRRKDIHQIELTRNYARFLRENPSEVGILFNELLIGVTSFFRDKAVWKTLKQTFLPDLIARLPDGHTVRIWVTACSTGEEAYSLAILFKECLDAVAPSKNLALQIFATDLDSDAVEKARRGVFSRAIEADVSSERLKRFFNDEGDRYTIKTLIRETIVFAVQNIIKDPPFTKLDLLSCRNMLIYMEAHLQQKLISLFHYSLRPQGIMLLGASESLGPFSENFVELDGKHKVFERSDRIGLTNPIDFPSAFSPRQNTSLESTIPVSTTDNIQTLADRVILQNFAPPSVLVNSKGDIVYVSGRTGMYLEPAVGKANWNVHAMARKGLREILPGAFRKALESSDNVVFSKLEIGTNGGTQFVNVTLKRIDNPPSLKGMVVIVFEDVAASSLDKKEKRRPISGHGELEAELQRSYDELLCMREEMQTSQEELKSTNEELQSTNEELQSTNEELTTSKEEMQSLNEELQSVNAELQSKVSEYIRISDDMKNLLNSTEIATLFLDQNLNVRRFTDQITKIFKLREVDIGRPFTELVTDLLYPEINDNAKKVLKTLNSREDQIETKDGRWFMVRIMPYRTINDHIDGLVLTFNDISVAKNLELELMAANEALTSKKKDGKPTDSQVGNQREHQE